MAPATMIGPELRSPDLSGDFDLVVRAYWPRIYRFALSSLGDPDAAGSVAQDCFLRAYQARHGFRDECKVETWLIRIAINLLRDRARSRRLQFWKRFVASDAMAAARHVDPGQFSPELRVLQREQVRAVWEVARSLPDRQRTVFLLRFVEDMDLLEIAAATGMREGTVKVQLFRAVHAVREKLGSR